MRRLTIQDLRAASEEVLFRLADKRNEMVDLFFAATPDFAQAEAAPHHMARSP